MRRSLKADRWVRHPQCLPWFTSIKLMLAALNGENSEDYRGGVPLSSPEDILAVLSSAEFQFMISQGGSAERFGGRVS